MKTKQLFKYQSLALVIGLALFAALSAMPGTTRGQMFVSVNSNPFGNGGSNIYQYDPTAPTGDPAPNNPAFLSNLDHPRGLAFDSAGNLFVGTFPWDLDSQGNILGVSHSAVLKVSGGVASTFATFFNGTATALATDSAGNLFVSSQKFDDTESIIYKVAPDGTVSTFGSVPGQCFGLAIDSSGNLFAAGSSDSTETGGVIYEFTSGGVRSIFAGPEAFTSPEGPAGLAFDSAGNLFVSNEGNFGNDTILEFTPSAVESTFATGLPAIPRGLAFDGTGNLFVAEIGSGAVVGNILKFTGGTQTVFASQGFGTRGNRGPEYVAFVPPAAPPPTPPSTAVTLTFPDATEALNTTVVASVDQNSLPPPPNNFALTGSNLAFEITSPSAPTPPFIIAFTVPPSVYGSNGSGLKAMHYECDPQNPSNCNWVDRTIDSTNPNYPSNPAPYTIYGSVNSFSPFLVTKFKYGAQVQQPINADGTSVFNAKRGVVPVTFTLTSDGASTCQLPPATISVFRTSGGVAGSIDESVYLSKSDNGSNFRIDTTNCQYVYNLGTSSLGPGTYLVNISIGGSVAGSATFGLK